MPLWQLFPLSDLVRALRMTNDYKPDAGKPPVLDAVHIPFRRALLAVARMAMEMAAKHALEGAKDPFQEWRHLPDARRRLSNAAARHGDCPWTVNTADGAHMHAVHALWGWLAAVELWEEEQEKLDAKACCGAPDAPGGLSEIGGYAAPVLPRQHMEPGPIHADWCNRCKSRVVQYACTCGAVPGLQKYQRSGDCLRCQAVSTYGSQCSKELGHLGDHQCSPHWWAKK